MILRWFTENWNTVVPIGLSVIAIIFTAFKDFILPWFFKPKLEITYMAEAPYKKGPVVKNSGSMFEIHERFKVENVGRAIAKNVRCQVYQVKDHNNKSFDIQGYHLKWASRPESAQDFSKVERLNIAVGESEFVDFVYMRTDNTTNIYFSKYPNIPSGMDESLPIGDYVITSIVSGDNFKPYIVAFKIHKKLEFTGVNMALKEVTRR